MSEAPRRVRTWKVVGALVVVLAVLAGLIAGWVNSSAQQAFEKMEIRLAALRFEAEQRIRTRPVLRGEPVPGNAWDDYKATPGLWPKSSQYQPAMVQAFLDGKPFGDPEFVRSYVALSAPMIDRLRAGTRRAEVYPPFEWSKGWFPVAYHQTQALNPCDAARCAARLLREEGRHREAMELLLDVCQYGRDLRQNSTPDLDQCGKWIVEKGFRELGDLVQAGGLPSEQRRQLDRELTILDQGWPDPTPAVQNLVCLLGSGMIGEDQTESIHYGALEPRYLHSWRWIFSSRLRVTSTVAMTDAWCQSARQSENLPWPQHRQARAELLAEVVRWPEPIVDAVVKDTFKWPNHSRDALARLRLLRVAAHFLATGEMSALPDPFGKTLGSSITGGHLKVWSAGMDGSDDGGAGDWVAGKDLVLEVKR